MKEKVEICKHCTCPENCCEKGCAEELMIYKMEYEMYMKRRIYEMQRERYEKDNMGENNEHLWTNIDF